MLASPFLLVGRVLLATFKIFGYLIVMTVESLWYLGHGDASRIGNAIGDTGRKIVDAIADAVAG